VVLSGLDPASFLTSTVSKALENGDLDPDSPEFHLQGSLSVLQSAKGGMTPEFLEEFREGFIKTLGTRLSSREIFQIWHCLRTLGAFPPASTARSVLGVCVESFSESPFLLFCDKEKSCFGIWEGGSEKFAWYNEGEATQLVGELLAASEAGLELFSASEELPALLNEGEFLVTILTPSGWRYLRVLESEVDVGPLGVIHQAFLRLRRLMLVDAGVEFSPTKHVGFDKDDPKWVYPSLFVRLAGFSLDLFSYLAGVFLVGYGAYVFQGGLTLLWVWGLMFGAFFFFPFYLALFESSQTHTSFGKRFFSLYVVSTLRGTGTSFLQALARNFCKCYLSWSFGWIWGVFNPHKCMFHDVLMDTIVIFDEKEAELIVQLKLDLEP